LLENYLSVIKILQVLQFLEFAFGNRKLVSGIVALQNKFDSVSLVL